MTQAIRLLPFVASCVYSLPMQGLDGTLSVEIPGASWALLQDSQLVHSLEQQLVQAWCEGVDCSVSIEAADSSRRAMQTGDINTREYFQTAENSSESKKYHMQGEWRGALLRLLYSSTY